MTQPPKVLIIDDDPDFKSSVRCLLEEHGYLVMEAASGKEGLDKLVQNKPDVVLLDVMMSYCDEGYGVNQAIKWRDEYREYQDVPIIMVSSIQQTPDELFAMAGEVEMIRPDWYVTKPVDIPKFLETVERAIACVLTLVPRIGTSAELYVGSTKPIGRSGRLILY